MQSETLTEALDGIAAAIEMVARALDRLGTGDAGTSMGAIELLSLQVKLTGREIAEALTKEPKPLDQEADPAEETF